MTAQDTHFTPTQSKHDRTILAMAALCHTNVSTKYKLLKKIVLLSIDLNLPKSKYEMCQQKGQFLDCMKIKNLCAQNLVFKSYLIIPLNQNYQHHLNHVVKLYKKLQKFHSFL